MAAGSDKDLGIGRSGIERRDFLQGALIGAGAALLGGVSPALASAAQAQTAAGPSDYPPARLDMRGSHPGSFEAAHQRRDGGFSDADLGAATDVGETYDLVVVGGGISGLSAAHFYRVAEPRARILILDNHDDFGGHAKRNEFTVAGRTLLMNGGTWAIESPTPYSPVAAGLLTTLGVDPVDLAKACDRPGDHAALKPAVFFDKETFGADRLVVGLGRDGDKADMAQLLAQAPLTEVVRRHILRIETGTEDHMPGLSSDAKKDRLSRISYKTFLTDVVKADPGVVPYYQHVTDGWWGCGIDAVSALDCWATHMPGFEGMGLAPGPTARMGYTPAGLAATGGSPTFHFPDGNASIARLLVRDLIPAAAPGTTAQDIVTARLDYGRLDLDGAPVRIRLNSIVVRARNLGQAGQNDGVEVVYNRGGRLWRVRGRGCVMAGWNMMIPYLCPELPEPQKAALHALIKTPLVYTSVALRNWTSFAKLGISSVRAPGGYHSDFRLVEPVEIGGYRTPTSPEEPTLIRMERAPAHPGLPERQQHKFGRMELLATPFETFERNIRDQLGRTLGAGGFDPARDIAGIAVNRWPHGYAPEYNCLVDGDLAPDQRPNVLGRVPFGRITIANADAGMAAYTDVAIDQAHRAVGELLGMAKA